jgi:hypothetical protein
MEVVAVEDEEGATTYRRCSHRLERMPRIWRGWVSSST